VIPIDEIRATLAAHWRTVHPMPSFTPKPDEVPQPDPDDDPPFALALAA